VADHEKPPGGSAPETDMGGVDEHQRERAEYPTGLGQNIRWIRAALRKGGDPGSLAVYNAAVKAMDLLRRKFVWATEDDLEAILHNLALAGFTVLKETGQPGLAINRIRSRAIDEERKLCRRAKEWAEEPRELPAAGGGKTPYEAPNQLQDAETALGEPGRLPPAVERRLWVLLEAKVQKLLDQMPEQRRQIVRWKCTGLIVADIAAKLGLDQETVLRELQEVQTDMVNRIDWRERCAKKGVRWHG